MTSFLKSTTDFTKNAASQGAQGVTSVGNAVVGTVKPNDKEENQAPVENDQRSAEAKDTPKAENQPVQPTGNAITSGFNTVGNAFTSGASSVWNPAVSASKAGAGFLQDIGSQGLAIGQKVAKTGADVTSNVVLGAADLTGTAVGGVIAAAVDTTGKAFEPVANGLKAIDGLQGLGEGLEKVNGLPIKAVQELGNLSMKALNMSGLIPTFFDPDGDGVVLMEDTIKGLIVLGLEEKYARYAAYALHIVFSYSTSSSWIPSRDTIDTKTMPIRVEKMSNTRWGKNWGTYERMDWCQDVDVDTFFDTSSEDTGTFDKWKASFKKGRQYFGALLLIFEWGTTWPFVMPPVPAQEVPFRNEMGMVVRKLVLPTISENYKRSHNEEDGKRKNAATKPPSEDAPVDSKDA